MARSLHLAADVRAEITVSGTDAPPFADWLAKGCKVTLRPGEVTVMRVEDDGSIVLAFSSPLFAAEQL